MIGFKRVAGLFGASLQGGRFPSAFPERCWWAGRHPIASVYIELEEDDYQEIAQKLERWEHVEAQGSLSRLRGNDPAC